MAQSTRVFISHTHADNERCDSLVERLREWGVETWYDRISGRVGDMLTDQILRGIEASDVFIRICTPAAAQSAWMNRELGMFQAYRAMDSRPGNGRERKLIPVCFDGYEPEPHERVLLYVDAAGKPEAAWHDGLRRALDRPMGWIRFDRSDADYSWWVKAYPKGFVVNADRKPRADGLTLHRSTCGHVTGNFPAGAFVERGYIKICAEDRAELERWAREEVDPGATLNAGCNCIVHGTGV